MLHIKSYSICRRYKVLTTICCTGLLLFGVTTCVSAQDNQTNSDQTRATASATPRQNMLLASVEIGPWIVPIKIGDLVSAPTKAGNAATFYAKLEQLFPQDRTAEDSFEVKTDAKGIDEILEGAQIRNSQLTPDFYPYMDNGTSLQPDLIVFQSYLFGIISKAKALEDQADYSAADKTYQATVIWGAHLLAERPNLVTYLIGLSIEAHATKEYARFLQRRLDISKSMAMHEYHEKLLSLRKRTLIKTSVYLGEFRNFNCLFSTIKVATEDPEPMWRQEAVLRLGVLRHGAPSTEDNILLKDKNLQAMAEEALKLVAEKDPKEWIRKLAVWSIQNVTPERFSQMRKMSLFAPDVKKNNSK